MAKLVWEKYSKKVDFEIRLDNFAKSKHFPYMGNVWITKSARFTKKAIDFRNSTFVVGIDTFERLGNIGYHNYSINNLEEAIKIFERNRINFIVFDRKINGKIKTLDDINVSENLKNLASRMKHENTKFASISSTVLREN